MGGVWGLLNISDSLVSSPVRSQLSLKLSTFMTQTVRLNKLGNRVKQVSAHDINLKMFTVPPRILQSMELSIFIHDIPAFIN